MFNILWLNPTVLFALGAVAAPILIHILVQRRAEAFPFPTLRFLRPTPLAAIRRHVLEDGALLAVRAAILAAAVAALAGPLVITPARRHTWERRIVRAVVVDANVAAPRETAVPPLTREFISTSLPDGIRRAVAWLEIAPPARRELVVVSPFAIGSLTAADIAAIPEAIGIGLERAGTLPATRTVTAGHVFGAGGVFAREITLDGARTAVHEAAAPEQPAWPIEIVSAPSLQPVVDAAVAAVLSQRVWAPAPGRRARLVVVDRTLSAGDASPIRTPWIADAAAGLLRNPELQAAAARVASGLADARLPAAGWQAVAFSADGRPLATAAESSGKLIVASAAPASELFTPLLMRSVANVLGAAPDLQPAEVVPIAERQLREWARPAAIPTSPTIDSLRQDGADNDRRWLWLAALCLLGFETWLRRARTVAVEHRVEASRVA